MNAPEPPSPSRASVLRAEVGPWAIELLPGAAYQARYIASQAAIGFAFDSQGGRHAIGSDRIRPFHALPNGLAMVPPGCDVFSESPRGGEYLRVLRTDGALALGERPFNDFIDPQAIALAQRMRNALLRPGAADDWQTWATALCERAQAALTASADSAGQPMTTPRLRTLDEFIDAHLGEPLTVQAMAALLGLSEGFFMRAFKQAVGKSPHSYLIDRRLARARLLLRDTAWGLAAIAQACGFASQAHMATLFKQRLGISPSALRA